MNMLTIIFIVLLTLKIASVISISWFLVFLPLLLGFFMIGIALVGVGLCSLLINRIKKIDD